VSKFYFLFIFAEMWRTVQNLKESAYIPEVPFLMAFPLRCPQLQHGQGTENANWGNQEKCLG
jgi:hypothetical protein